MRQLLCLSASARQSRSLSRELLDVFIKEWSKQFPNDHIITRDIGKNPPSYITEDWIAGAFNGEDLTQDQRNALKESDTLLAELIPSQIVVFATPMYNYGMPAALKAWFDQTVRVNKTFSFDLNHTGNPCQPIQSNKIGIILSASGEGELLKPQCTDNHLHPHIRKASELLGIETFKTIAIEYQEFGDQRFKDSLSQAHNAVPELVSEFH